MAGQDTGKQVQAEATDLPGNTKVTREDWLHAAMEVLISDGVQSVKVLTIGGRLGVSRSSFYWYFQSRQDLLDQLLAEWERTNTGVMISHAAMPAPTIPAALNNFFRCVVDPKGFNHRLDFAVREWARRDDTVRAALDRSDTARQKAIAEMFTCHGYTPQEADIRARVLYYQQIGYYALELSETLEERLSRVAGYLYCFTGQHPAASEVEDFKRIARSLAE